ncbi:hypothetical protein BIW11_03777 [Tropilaelaps mercedesae]|uniref:Uncharacterized protein n=1 Tax=Tropilaelaps mercedesae TaxID=418985 RepID=A0A1V9XFU7_9ACAR|nr:hypothetical protein BIW11_03777 [Tropilaelaps mercedesae]
MRPLPPVPLKCSQTLESVNSADSDKTVSVTLPDKPEVVRMTPKVDVEVKFNGEKLNGNAIFGEIEYTTD